MSELTVTGSTLGTPLQELLLADTIEPGASASYQLCKLIYLHHPLGAKMAESPIRAAQSQQRIITIPGTPEGRVRDAFVAEWKTTQADRLIANLARVSRIYGLGTIVMGAVGEPTQEAIDPWKLPGMSLFFNVVDPLNTSGSAGAANQNPNAPTFQRMAVTTVQGQTYHPSRTCLLMNEEPTYLSFTSSAFGFSGRSVYQRALFPLKTFVQSMVTDDMVCRKAGVLVAKIANQGSAVDRLMAAAGAVKRAILKEARTDNVIQIGKDDEVSSLDLSGIDAAAGAARKNALENTAVAADMPAIMLNSETFAEGFADGTEDAKNVARYVDRIRIELDPAYAFFDNIVQYRAWTPDFYATIQAEYPEYEAIDYKTAFFEWRNAFKADWPSLLIEPDSKAVLVEDVKLKGIIALVEVLSPNLDPDNKATLIQWATDNVAENKLMFPNPLNLDMDALRAYVPPAPPTEPTEPEPENGDA